MTPAELIAAFDVLAEAPDGVKRLRELVLQLAVRGRLVPQDPAEEPASTHIRKIVDEKVRRGRTERMRLSTMQTYDFEPPAGWVVVAFGDACINRDGERVPVSAEIRAGRRGTYDYYGASGVIDKVDDFLFEGPLLLVGEDGANLVLRSTPIAFMADGRFWVNNHAHVLDSIDPIALRYLAIFLNGVDLKPYLTGTAQPKLNQAKMNGIPTPVPPLAEQHRIVARVDELMALLDRLEAARNKRESLRAAARDSALAALRDATDQAAVDTTLLLIIGQLPHLFVAHADVEVLRKTVRELAVRGRLLRPGPVAWPWVKWADVGQSQNGRAFPSSEYRDTGVKLLRPGNLHRNGSVSWTSSNTRCMAVDWAQRYPAHVVGGREVVMNLTAQSLVDDFLGRVCLTALSESCLLNQRLARLTPLGWSPEYCLLLFKSPMLRKQIDVLNQGTLIQHMFTSQVDAFEFPLPPLEEQHRIVAKVDELMALCDALEASLTTARDLQTAFAAAAVHHLDTSTPVTAPAVSRPRRARPGGKGGDVGLREMSGGVT